MDRTRARVLASAFHSATVWIGCALGACLTAGCASPGQLSESSGRGSPPACACQSNVAQQSKPKNGASNPAAHPSPHTVGQAWRAYVDCLHSPLSRRGPAMNVEEGRGDTGVSRYPPAGGERYPQRGPAMNVGEGRGDTGVSSFPPAEGERNVPAEAPRPPSGAEPTEDNGAVGPPGPTAAASTRAGANAPKGKGGADRQRDHLQATTVSREKAVFPFPSFNSTGLLPIEPLVASMTGTLCLAAALRESEKDDDQDIFDSDTLGSDGPGRTSGGEGIADSEIKRVGAAETRPLLARLGLDPRQTFGSGGESGDISQRQGDTGLSRYPPAAGERSFPSAGAPAEAKGLFGKNEAAWYSACAGNRGDPGAQRLPGALHRP